jgi:hypothetical protein
VAIQFVRGVGAAAIGCGTDKQHLALELSVLELGAAAQTIREFRGSISMKHADSRREPDRFETAVVRLALAWLPYGGADADITYDEFGFSLEQYARRLLDILDTCSLPDISEPTKRRLRHVALLALRPTAEAKKRRTGDASRRRMIDC